MGKYDEWLGRVAPKAIEMTRKALWEISGPSDTTVFVPYNPRWEQYVSSLVQVEINGKYNNKNFDKIRDWLKAHDFKFNGKSWERDIKTMRRRKN